MEGDAGISQLNPTDAEGSSAQSEQTEETEELVSASEAPPVEAPVAVAAGPSRLTRNWVIGICAALFVLGAGVALGGYLVLRANSDSQATANQEAVALRAAKECVAATQAPDTAAMAASQQKIIDCSTGDFAVQANMYAGMLVDAYQAANVQVKVSDIRAAIERHNDDGSVQVLVAVRVQVTNSAAANQEQGYRLRVRMAPDGGTYKIARLDQVSS